MIFGSTKAYGIKNDLVSSWVGMSQLTQITVMFVVNLKKSFIYM